MPAEMAAEFLLDHTDESNLESNINSKSLSSLQKGDRCSFSEQDVVGFLGKIFEKEIADSYPQTKVRIPLKYLPGEHQRVLVKRGHLRKASSRGALLLFYRQSKKPMTGEVF